MIDSDKAELLRAIEVHLAAHGAQEWSMVQDRFPAVPPATFWRYVRKVRAGDSDAGKVAAARQMVARHVAESRAGVDEASRRSERPSEIVGWRQLNLVQKMEEVFADLQLLRAAAFKGDGGLKNPHLLGQTVAMRDRSVTTALRCGEAILDQDRAWAFYDALVEEVARESPAAAERICGRLKDVLGQLQRGDCISPRS